MKNEPSKPIMTSEQNEITYVPVKQVTANLSKWERIGSIALGTLAIYQAMKSKSVPLASSGAYLFYRGTTGQCHIKKALEWNADVEQDRKSIIRSIEIALPAHQVYGFWKEYRKFPNYTKHLDEVEQFSDKRAIWVVNKLLRWESKVVHDDANTRIGWKSLDSTLVNHYGNVHFDALDSDRTKVTVAISYKVPFGRFGKMINQAIHPLLGMLVQKEMNQLKAQMELKE